MHEQVERSDAGAGGPAGPAASRAVLPAVTLAVLLSAMDQTIVGTALPRIAGELGRLDLYPWVFTAYLVAVTVVVPIAGQLGDRHGRRSLLLAGMGVFIVGSLAAGLAPTMPALIGCRALQGLGAGALVANAYAVLADLYAPAQVGRYTGLLSGVYGLASVIGPIVGGLVTDGVGWRWAFLINVPLGLAAVVPLAIHAPRKRPGGASPATDHAGIVLLTATLVPALLALARVGGAGFDRWTFAAAAVSLLAGVGLVVVESRAAAPILPPHLLRDPIVGLTSLIAFLASAAFYACSIYLPLALQVVHGFAATAAGLAMTPMVLALVAGSIIGGVRVSRSGRCRPVVQAGLLAMCGGLLALAVVGVGPGLAVPAALTVVGLGIGLALPALTVAAQNAAQYAEIGVATALGKFARSLGGIVGIGVFGALLERQVTHAGAGIDAGAAAPRIGAQAAAIDAGVAMILASACGLALAALVCAVLLRELPLRRTITTSTPP
ncbi:MFS transporter [Nannocystis sp.]|uniref:MFS transporter n=1 Tax=Nannocystis sp. TaxID=1962667 RepID=UPI0024273EF6|nr:MFS transporter [Nannocystis sp.]MBK7828665.1 MFS transporter [Nannocystis sp.]MBK9754031.1 MFS transporter [Nannocystis sp.]